MKKRKSAFSILWLCLLFILLITPATVHAAYILDSFDANISGGSNMVKAIAIQSDGKILIGGSFANVDGQALAYLARLTSTGDLDTTFLPNLNESVRAIALQSDGKIMVGGDFDYVDGTFQAYIARLNTNGSRDSSFYNFRPSGEVNAIAIQSNGKILIGWLFGGIDDVVGKNVYIARLNTDGNADATFCGYGGTTFCDPGIQGGSPTTLITSIVIQTNGQIIIGGQFATVQGENRKNLALLNTAGTLEETFVDAGLDTSVDAIAIDSSGKILIGGSYYKVGSKERLGVARFTNSPADFNNDSMSDILWRNTTTGRNVVWYMNGTVKTGYAFLATQTVQAWKIVGTRDFNNDGKPDILWRNTSTGKNVVWYMNGAVKTSYAYLRDVTDTNWKIVGTGDYNSDSKPDILWRNTSTGKNLLWYMDGAVRSSYAYTRTVTDTAWTIVGK